MNEVIDRKNTIDVIELYLKSNTLKKRKDASLFYGAITFNNNKYHSNINSVYFYSTFPTKKIQHSVFRKAKKNVN